MDRREFARNTALGAAALGAGLGPRASLASSRPNIVIIMADDLGYGDLGCYGSPSIATPNLDRLASEGVRLTDFYSSAPVCSPSRCGLLTGRYPVRAGVYGVYWPSRNPATPLLHAAYGLGPGLGLEETLSSELIKEAGYRTCCVGKWHLGDLKRYRPNHRGFDHYFGVHYSNDMQPLTLYRNDEVAERAPVDQDYLTRQYTEEATSWIRDNRDRPFFLYMPHTFPHIPLHCSPEFRGRSAAGLYGDVVEEMDWSVGEVMKTLEEEGLADNTLVFFTSDNGPWYQGSPGDHRGRKAEIFEGGMRVPGIARLPGVIPAGTVSDAMAMNIDLFSTALALAGAKPPADRPIDGMDILPMLAGGESPHDALFFFNKDRPAALRTRDWKYHDRHAFWATKYTFAPKGPMLFDLRREEGESYNVIDKYPEVADEMRETLDNFKKGFVRGVPG